MSRTKTDVPALNFYYEQGTMFATDQADHTWPKTGFAVRPGKIYVPLR